MKEKTEAQRNEVKTQTNTGIKRQGWDFLAIQWLGLAIYCRGTWLNPGQGTRSQMLQLRIQACHTKTQHRQINKIKQTNKKRDSSGLELR